MVSGGVVMLVGVWSSVDGDAGDDGMVLWRGCSGVVGGGGAVVGGVVLWFVIRFVVV